MCEAERRDEDCRQVDDDPLAPLRTHPVYELVPVLAEFLGMEADFIAFIKFLSLVAGAKATPINVEVVTDQLGIDLAIADRISAIVPRMIARVDTYQQLKAEERNEFEGRAVIIVRPDVPKFHQKVERIVARTIDTLDSIPSVWRIVPRYETPALTIPSLRLLGKHSDRRVDRFPSTFAASPGDSTSRDSLAAIIESILRGVTYTCKFRERFTESSAAQTLALPPMSMLVVERMLQVFTHLRRVLTESRTEAGITPEDYEAVRALLVHLPLVPMDRAISAQALDTATSIHRAIETTEHQLALPDQSGEGHRWFTRKHAVTWTGLCYTSVKKHLAELEDDGLIVSTVDRNNRQHGRVIHYRFADSRAPPFEWTNPFEQLPSLGHEAPSD